MSDKRYVKVYSAKDGWITKEFEELKENDVFMLFDPDGKVVKSPPLDDAYIYIALSDAYFSEEHNSYIIQLGSHEDK